MSAESVSGALLYEALEPLAREDAANDYALLAFCEALLAPLEVGYELVRDHDNPYSPPEDAETISGWQRTFDPLQTPAWVLPYLAQYAGVRLTPAMSEADARTAIGYPEGFRRGTLGAMTSAVQRTLTGSQTVYFEERYGDAAYQLRVRTLASETPDANRSLEALLSQKPIGIVLTYENVVGLSWSDVPDVGATWAAIVAGFDSWAELLAEPPPP